MTPPRIKKADLAQTPIRSLDLTVPANYTRFSTISQPTTPKTDKSHVTIERGSTQDSVTTGQSQGVTLFKFRQHLKSGALKPVDHYCAIPASLLRDIGLFENPFDFMVYMHFFAQSYGFGRNTCDMGLSKLEAFTGLARNSVKKSIESLSTKGWIQMIQDFECGQVTRKWRVFTPYETGHSPNPTFRETSEESTKTTAEPVTGSPHDTVKPRHCHLVPQTVSAHDPLTGSRDDTYKDILLKKTKRHSLPEEIPRELREYFETLKPQSKHASEWEKFCKLRTQYSDEDLAGCVKLLREQGLPGSGEACHSPMAFLEKAIESILSAVRDKEQREELRKTREDAQRADKIRRDEEAERESQEWKIKANAFGKTFGGEERQQEVIHELVRFGPFKTLQGEAAKTYAISIWWSRLNQYERKELAG